MEKKFIKNVDQATVLSFSGLVDYQAGRVVSLTLAQNEALSMTLFAFGQGESVSTHSAPGDALACILDGRAEITIGADRLTVKAGEAVVMPANVPHGLDATENFKMLLVLVKQ
jgi:Uncharacterized conserved protein, contains double-stranded beta-helix domain